MNINSVKNEHVNLKFNNNKTFCLKLDTGAEINILTKADYVKRFELFRIGALYTVFNFYEKVVSKRQRISK